MLQRAPSTIALLLLAACQSAPHQVDSHAVNADSVNSHGIWRDRIGGSHGELMRELEGVRALLAARAMATTEIASSNVGASIGSLDALEWTAKIAELSGRVDQLQAALASRATAGPVDASHSIPSSSIKEGALKALKQSLLALAEDHALHCENIANANVPGYKRRTLGLASQADASTGIRMPAATRSQLITTQGALELTCNDFDFGIEGEGYFEFQRPDGSIRYTRNGRLRRSFSGRIVTAQGHLLTDQVCIPTGTISVSVASDGQVFGLLEGNNLTAIGTLRLHVFTNPSALEPCGPSSFKPTAESGMSQARLPGIQGTGLIRQGYLEQSNVNVTAELIDLQLIERQAAAIRRTLANHGIYAR